ncbi:MAG TPA: cytochrome P450 [Pseudomonadales bacterium]|nr:cytochrome P450 [Pseudomonadales bacterium]
MRLRQKIEFKVRQVLANGLSLVERGLHGVSLNLLDPALARDPYPLYNRMREKAPVHYSLAMRVWWVTRFDYVQEILRDKRFGSDIRKFPDQVKKIVADLDDEQRERFENPSMLSSDPPDHTRLRKLVSQGFVHKFIQSLEPRIHAIVESCLRRIDNDPTFDVVDVLAKPLPAVVIAEMMGLPESDHAQFQAWSEDLIEATSTNDIETVEKGQAAESALIAYFRDVVERKRGAPGDDLIGMLIRAEEEGDKLSERELYNTCLLLLVAGHETTTRLIGNGVFLLLQHGRWNELRAHPERIPTAVEEMLRFEPPVQATQRFVLEDLDFHGKPMKRGDSILVSIAGGNRDPNANADPDRFDIGREKVNQVSFGYGIHLCIGASLARLEAKVAFEKLLERFPDLTLCNPEPQWGVNPIFRGHRELHVGKSSMVEDSRRVARA